MPYIGKTPSQATRARYYLTASGGETSISGSMTVGGTLTFTDGNFVDVSVNGVAVDDPKSFDEAMFILLCG